MKKLEENGRDVDVRITDLDGVCHVGTTGCECLEAQNDKVKDDETSEDCESITARDFYEKYGSEQESSSTRDPSDGDDPRKLAMPKHSGAAGYDRWIENEWGRYDADDEDDGVPMDGYHKSIIQGWTPLYSMDDVYGTEGRVREGEENPRCPAHSARRLAVALNLGPRELRTNPDAIQACTKEWIKLL